MKKNINAKVVALVPSDSNPAKSYRISRTDKGLMCNCMAFRFIKGEIGSPQKACKHILRLVAA